MAVVACGNSHSDRRFTFDAFFEFVRKEVCTAVQGNATLIRVLMDVTPDVLGRRLATALKAAGIEVLARVPGEAGSKAVLFVSPDAIRGIEKQAGHEPMVIVVVCGSDDKFFDGAMVSAVDGIVDRDDDYGDLCRAVKSVAAGHGWISPHLVPRYRDSVIPTVDLHVWEMLTNAERRTAELVLKGKSNKQAAALLGVSEATIKSHLSRAYAKLAVRSRAELIALVVRMPLVTTGGFIRKSRSPATFD